jgi:hypothetical protein
MLRASADATGQQVDMRGVGLVAVDSGVPGDAVLSALTDAAVLRDVDEIGVARERCIEVLGPATTMRAAAVAANFEMMNRLLDAVGVGPSRQMLPIGDEIGVPRPDRFS